MFKKLTISMFLLIPLCVLSHECEKYTIRPTEKKDFPKIAECGAQVFTQVYGVTTPAQVTDLKKRYQTRIHSEEEYFLQHPEMLSLVVTCNDKIIAFFSTQTTDTNTQLYLRHVFVDTAFQKQGIFKTLLKKAFDSYPQVTFIVLLANKKNTSGHTVYERVGGIRSENPEWLSMLDHTLPASDYIGYSIPRPTKQTAKQFAQK